MSQSLRQEISRLEKDRARKRDLRQQIRQLAAPVYFRAWFREGVNEMPPSDGAWSERLAKCFSGGDESDRTLRRYYSDKGTAKPWAPSAYKIGWAFHDAGVRWCSGPLGLLSAGRAPEFFRLLAFMAQTGDGRRLALRFALAGALANERIATYLEVRDFQQTAVDALERTERLKYDRLSEAHLKRQDVRRDNAREAVSCTRRHRSLIDEAWDGYNADKTLRSAPGEFRLAIDIIESSRCAWVVRFKGALTLLAEAARARGGKDEEVIRELITLSPIVRLEDWADAFLRDPGLVNRAMDRIMQRNKVARTQELGL